MKIKNYWLVGTFICFGMLTSCGGAHVNNGVTPISWGKCAQLPDTESKFTCATINVPLDYSNVSLGTTKLAVVKYQENPTSTKALFANPGGPWGSVSDDVSFFKDDFNELNKQQYAIIYFDPRGVGLSNPLSDCPLLIPPTLNSILTRSGFSVGFDNYQNLLTSCFTIESNPVKNYMSTTAMAYDMDYIRKAAGYTKISFIGYSYGTQLGSVYLSLFPNNVDKMVLDSNMNPDHQLLPLLTSSAAAFQSSLNYLLDQCNLNTNCVLYPNAHQQYDDLITLIEKGQVINQYGSPIMLQDFYDELSGMLLRLRLYPQILTLISQTLSSKTFTVEPQENIITGNNLLYSIVMGSDLVKTNLSSYNQALFLASQYWNQNSLSSYILLSNNLEDEELVRSYSSLPNHPLANLTYPANTPKVLVTGNYYDPSTVYADSIAMSQTIPNSVLVSFAGAGHISTIQPCVNAYMNNYLLTGDTPPTGTVCPANNPSSKASLGDVNDVKWLKGRL